MARGTTVRRGTWWNAWRNWYWPWLESCPRCHFRIPHRIARRVHHAFTC